MSINRASAIFRLALWIINWLYNSVNSLSNCWPPLHAKMLSTRLELPSKNEGQRCNNSFGGGSVSCTAMYCTASLLNRVINGQSCLYISIFNFTNMHALSHRSDFYLAGSSKVNISEPADHFTIMFLLTATQIAIPSNQNSIVFSDSRSLSMSLQAVMISSKHDHIFICYLIYLTLQIIFHAWWASISVG
jgi:hypothetical protein